MQKPHGTSDIGENTKIMVSLTSKESEIQNVDVFSYRYNASFKEMTTKDPHYMKSDEKEDHEKRREWIIDASVAYFRQTISGITTEFTLLLTSDDARFIE